MILIEKAPPRLNVRGRLRRFVSTEPALDFGSAPAACRMTRPPHAGNSFWNESTFLAAALAAWVVFAQHALRASDGFPSSAGAWLIALLLAAELVVIRRLAKFDVWLMAILIVAAALYLQYSTYTDLVERNYDGREHLFYARYLADHAALPGPRACAVCRHPPLYHALGALVIRLVEWLRLTTEQSGLQVLSLGLSLVFLAFGALVIEFVTVNRFAQRLAVALLAFWPSAVLNSVRVHDDAMESALGAGVLYFTLRWYDDDRTRSLSWATALAALAVLTKANAYALALLLLVTVGFRCARARFTRRRLKQFGLTSVAVASATVAAVVLPNPSGQSSACHRAIGVVCDLNSEHFVGNRLVNYAYFDVGFFLRQPFLLNDPYDKAKDYFLNNLLKTSLFNAIPLGPEFEDRLSATLAIVFGWLMLGLILFVAIGLAPVAVRRWRRYWPLAIGSALLLGQLIALRLRAPFAMHADFRYAFVLLIPACAGFAKAFELNASRARGLAIVGLVLGGSLVVASALFFRPDSHRHKGHDYPPEEPILCSLAEHAAPKGASTRVGDAHNLHFGPNQKLVFPTPEGTLLSKLDVSLDADDQYQIVILARGFSRLLLLGPSSRSESGLMRYVKDIAPPLRDAQSIEISGRQSDGYFALGHLIINGTSSPGTH